MNEEQLYAKIGRLQTVFEGQQTAYRELLQRLAWVVSGEVERSRVLVNLTDQTWSISELGTRPGTPATINGLPLVVVAPDEPVKAEPEPINSALTTSDLLASAAANLDAIASRSEAALQKQEA